MQGGVDTLDAVYHTIEGIYGVEQRVAVRLRIGLLTMSSADEGIVELNVVDTRVSQQLHFAPKDRHHDLDEFSLGIVLRRLNGIPEKISG